MNPRILPTRNNPALRLHTPPRPKRHSMAKPTAAGERKRWGPTGLEQRDDRIRRRLGNSRGPNTKHPGNPGALSRSELRAWDERPESAAAANRRLAPNADSGQSGGFT